VPGKHRGERIRVSRVQGPDLRHLARPWLYTARLVLEQRDVGEIDARTSSIPLHAATSTHRPGR
jgi:hypothetical protein